MCFPSVSGNKDCVCLVTAQPKLSVNLLYQNRRWNWCPSLCRLPLNIVSKSLENFRATFQVRDIKLAVIYTRQLKMTRGFIWRTSINRLSNNFRNASNDPLVVCAVAPSCLKKLSLILIYQFWRTVCVSVFQISLCCYFHWKTVSWRIV